MEKYDKSNKDLIKELADLRKYISEIEASKAQLMQVESELRNSEEKWRLLYENLPGGSFVINSQYIIQDVNDVLCETTGYKREELIGKLCDIICPRGPHKCPIFIDGKKKIDNDKTAVKTKDGRLVPILKSARKIPLRGEELIVENFKDISETSKIEKELKESEELLRNILAASPIGIAYAKDRKVVWANESMAKIFGFEDEKEYLGKDTYHLYTSDEEYQRIGKMIYEGMMTGDLIETDAKFKRNDGSVFDGHVRVSVIDPSDPMRGIIVNILDITQRKKIEDELLRLSSAIEISNDSVVISDLDGKIIDVNESTLKICKIKDKNDLIGKTPLDIITPEEKGKTIGAMKETLKKGYINNREFNVITSEGDKVPIEMNATLMKDKDGKPIGFVAISRDITERKQAEKNLRFLSSITEQVTDSIIVTNMDYTISYTNKACEELYCYSKDELIGKSPDILNAEPLADDIQKDIYKTVSSGDTWVGNHLNKRKDGSTFFTELKVSPLYDKNGHIISYIGIQRDITKRIASEDALKYSEERFKDIAENAMEWIWEVDKNGKYIYSSPVVEKILGYKHEELLEKHFYDFFHPDDLEGLKKTAFEVFKKKLPFKGFINKNIHKNGKLVWLSTSGVPIVDNEGNLVGYRGSDTDITERKKAEELLKESEKKYRELVENIDDIIYVLDSEGKFKFINKTLEKALGYSIDEILNRNFKDFVTSNSYKYSEELFRRMLTGEDVGVFEIELYDKNDQIRIIENKMQLIWEGDRVEELTGIARDITEKKRIEEQLFNAQKMEAIGTLAGGIAHDFNNILAMILGYSSFLKNKAKKGDPFYDGLETIEESAVRASNLTSQLLAYTRKARMELKPIDLNRVLNEVYSFISKTFEKSIKIRLDIDEDLKTIEGDESQINQVLMNIAVNAHDFMPNGGTLDIKTYMKEVKKEIIKKSFSIEPGNYVCIKFSDTGIGMNEETISRMFEPYFTTREGKGGTGLGMSVAFGIIKGHNGYIDVESRPGEGTEITVYFPASKKKEKILHKKIEEVRGGDETILIIDDEKTILDMTKSILDDLGYTTHIANSGKDGIKIFNENEINLIILDIKMPDMGGKEVLEKILEINPDAKVLLSSGYSEENQHHDLLKIGAKDFIGKPFVSDKLLLKIRKILD